MWMWLSPVVYIVSEGFDHRGLKGPRSLSDSFVLAERVMGHIAMVVNKVTIYLKRTIPLLSKSHEPPSTLMEAL